MAFNTVARAPDLVKPRAVLVSAFDKRGLEDIVTCVARTESACRFYATGGSFDALRGILGSAADDLLVPLSDYTGQPEMAGGLVKSLDWKIHLGILAEPGDSRHEADLLRLGAVSFDLVIANLYPFTSAAGRAGIGVEELRQHIDIGGSALLRASAKNYLRVASVSDPGQYPELCDELRTTGGLCLRTRHRLAVASFALCSRLDAAISAGLDAMEYSELRATYLGSSS
ncbi:MAG TPA: hypothetical protein VMC79_01145 [Rectinemataceae bacterium]|nr:hypothetical protein [Rectinemataceae bacterium]